MSDLSASLAVLAQAFDESRMKLAERTATTAPSFSAFAYLRRDEFGISRIIADLLDPRGTHSQGALFLRLFIESSGLHNLDASQAAQVRTETPTATGRRIDITIRSKDWIIGIENKPWAKDQSLQVADYLAYLRSRGIPRCHLIYLTRSGAPPSAESISPQEFRDAERCSALRCLSYEILVSWLRRCREFTEAPRVRDFVAQFEDYILENVMNMPRPDRDTSVIEAILDERNRTALSTAIEIVNRSNSIREALLNKLYKELRARLPGWDISGTPMEKDDGLAMKPPGHPDWFFCVELDSKYGRWCYGLKRVRESRERAQSKLADELLSHFMGSEGPNRWWLMWLWFVDRTPHDPECYSDWNDNVQPWIDMSDGTLAGHLAALALELAESAAAIERQLNAKH